MPLLVVGSVALDSVETPEAQRDDILGGSAVYFSYAASYFTSVRLVGAVGDDWPPEHTQLLDGRGIDTSGLQVVDGGETFRWRGKYHENMNDRDTLEVHLNVFETFDPVLPETYKKCEFLFLANGSPVVQMKVMDQLPAAKLVVDMNLNDLVKRLVRFETKVERTTDVKIARPTGHNRQYKLIGFSLDAGNGIASSNPAKRLDLLTNSDRDARHAEIAARADLVAINGGGTYEEAHT